MPIERDKNWQVFNITSLHDDRLSLAAIGLHFHLMAAADGLLTEDDVLHRVYADKEAVEAGLAAYKELEACGYVQKMNPAANDADYSSIYVSLEPEFI